MGGLLFPEGCRRGVDLGDVETGSRAGKGMCSWYVLCERRTNKFFLKKNENLSDYRILKYKVAIDLNSWHDILNIPNFEDSL